ncbi:MAG: class I SAM-dependent methyltransferase [Myxococcales bacterium]|nr:class I SAM-dependent methyltransferase [Myxococcales bacterium]
MSDPSTPEAPAAAYSWLVGFDGDWRDTWWSQDFLELVAARLGLGELRALVDVGCGVGHWGQRRLPLLHRDATLVGLDREPGFVARAATAAQARGLAARASYRQALAEALPLATASADLVTCQTVLIHVADPAVVVAEMARVARPGGLVLAAEPNNFGEKASALVGAPGLSRTDRLALLELEAVCQDGKRLAGSGDSSVGERLPGLFAAAGLCDVRVCQNEKCAPLVPPYDTPGERTELRQMLSWIDGGVWLGVGGTREQTQAWYLGGGGDPARFDVLWSVARREAEAWKAAALAGTVSGARGPTFYLVAGRRGP